ncbi:MAG: metal-sulfur cluster assembly factor [Puniceicoccaceae bacterium]|nr:MAG: metal-sulfur cluster assembly factor [Puniceicoccaceae bacterium]
MGLTKDDVLCMLKAVQDPEIPASLVDLGLIYGIQLEDDPAAEGRSRVTVEMTLTSPGCPMAHSICSEVRRRLNEHPSISSAQTRLVWEPPWNPAKITPAGRQTLGLS